MTNHCFYNVCRQNAVRYKAVQTLSRLNRSHPEKHDTFVLDFANKTSYCSSIFKILSDNNPVLRTTHNKLYDNYCHWNPSGVHHEHVDTLVELYLNGGATEAIRLMPAQLLQSVG